MLRTSGTPLKEAVQFVLAPGSDSELSDVEDDKKYEKPKIITEIEWRKTWNYEEK